MRNKHPQDTQDAFNTMVAARTHSVKQPEHRLFDVSRGALPFLCITLSRFVGPPGLLCFSRCTFSAHPFLWSILSGLRLLAVLMVHILFFGSPRQDLHMYTFVGYSGLLCFSRCPFFFPSHRPGFQAQGVTLCDLPVSQKAQLDVPARRQSRALLLSIFSFLLVVLCSMHSGAACAVALCDVFEGPQATFLRVAKRFLLRVAKRPPDPRGRGVGALLLLLCLSLLLVLLLLLSSSSSSFSLVSSSLVLLIVVTLHHGPFRRTNTNPGASSGSSPDGFEDGSSGISISTCLHPKFCSNKSARTSGHPGMLKAETSAVLEADSFQFTRFPYRGVSTLAKTPRTSIAAPGCWTPF